LTKLLPYLDALDLSRYFAAYRTRIFCEIVPPILNRIAENGLSVLVGRDIERVMEFQSHHRDMPLFQPFDRRCQPSASQDDTIVLITQRDGVAVACLGARLKWVERGLDDDLRTLRFFYDDQVEQAPRGEICFVAPGVGDHIRSVHVALGGAAYIAEAERGFGLYNDLVKLLGIMELTAWRFTYQVALLTSENVLKTGIRTNGFCDFEAPIFRLKPGQQLKDRLYWLATRHREAVVADLLSPDVALSTRALNWPTEDDIAAARQAIWGSESIKPNGLDPHRDPILRGESRPSP
jgi:hypothetical protein